MDEAYASFNIIRDDRFAVNESMVQAEFNVLHQQLLHEKENAVSYADLFRLPHYRKRCIVGFLTMFGAQGTATLVINSKSYRDRSILIIVS